MFKTSILRAKIKRSNVNFQKTILWDDVDIKFSNNDYIARLFLDEDEEIILHYIKSKSYKWIFTNKRLIFPNYFKQILLSELVHVDFNSVAENIETKMTNIELGLSTNDETFKIILEEGTWHLFYEVFKFIIISNKNNSTDGNGID